MADSNPVDHWYRVCLNTIVRKDKDLSSERLRILPMGSRVYVVEIVGRRVKIKQPIEGWCSLQSSNGDKILACLEQGVADAPLKTPTAAAIEQRKKERDAASGKEKDALEQEIRDMNLALERKNQNIKKLMSAVKQSENSGSSSQVYNAQMGEKQNLRLCDVVWLEKKSLGMGIVRYIGPVYGQQGTWVGVEFETPIGDSDGTVPVGPNESKLVFQKPVQDKHAAFVRSDKVKLITGFDWLEVFLNLERQINLANQAETNAGLVQD